MKFELTYANGDKEIVKAGEISEAIKLHSSAVGNIIKVEEIDSKELKLAKKLLSVELNELGRKYLPAKELTDTLKNLFERYGFNPTDEVEKMSGNEGSQTVSIGKGTYLHWTWYRMPSGKFEFVGYLTN